MIDMLKEFDGSHIKVFGGGGGTITPDEIGALQEYGVTRIYHPDDGMNMGLVEMIEDVVNRTSESRVLPTFPGQVDNSDSRSIADFLSGLENGLFSESELMLKRREWQGA